MDYGMYTEPLTNSPVQRQRPIDLENCTASVIGSPIPTFNPHTLLKQSAEGISL